MEELKGIGINSMSIIKSSRKKTLIPKIFNEKDEIITSRKGIANVFGEFNSKLSSNEQQDGEDCTDDEVKMTYHTKLKDSEEPNKKQLKRSWKRERGN